MRHTLKNIQYFWIIVIIIISSCQPTEKGGHAHAPDGSHLDHGDKTPTVDATIWTDKTELFVEYPALVVGKTSTFAAHFTILDKHKPVLEGSVTVSLIKGKRGVRQKVDAPASPGIFKPSLQPKEAGVYQLVFEINTPAYSDKIVLNNIQVFGTTEAAINALNDEEEGNGITFLKEQAWKIEFQTARVIQGEIFEMIATSGVWKVSPSDHRTLVASTSGTVTFKGENMVEGKKVNKGQVLMTVNSEELTSNNLRADIQKAKADYTQAKLAYDRKKQLIESKIVSKAEFEQVEQKYQVTKSAFETLNAGYSVGGKQVVVPFNGYIKTIAVGNGSFVQEGAAMVVITSHQSSLLEAQISPSYASQLQSIHDVWYQPKSGVWSSLNRTGGTILSVGKEVESDKPLLSVFAKINDSVEMPEGSFTEVHLAFGQPMKTTIISESALLEAYGNYSVIVELSGESYERRPVTIGRRNGNEVEIKTGLSVGEMVVTKGAYQVKMASMSGAVPPHGHDH